MPPHPLTNFEIQKYFENKPKCNGVYSRKHLSKINYGTYIINLEEYKLVEAHWIALHINDNKEPILIALQLKIFQTKLKNSQKLL